MSTDKIVGLLLLRLSWEIILTSLSSKCIQKWISCIKSDRSVEVKEISRKWKKKICGVKTQNSL